MPHSRSNPARRAAAVLATATLLVAALGASTAALAGSNAFDARLSSVIAHVKADPGYRKIPLDTTDDREWFADESESLFRKKITKDQYVADGAKRFPGYEASFTELADLLTAP